MLLQSTLLFLLDDLVDEIFVPSGVGGEFRVEGGCNEVPLLDSHHRALRLQSAEHFDLWGGDPGDAWSPDENAMTCAGAGGAVTGQEVRVKSDRGFKTGDLTTVYVPRALDIQPSDLCISEVNNNSNNNNTLLLTVTCPPLFCSVSVFAMSMRPAQVPHSTPGGWGWAWPPDTPPGEWEGPPDSHLLREDSKSLLLRKTLRVVLSPPGMIRPSKPSS